MTDDGIVLAGALRLVGRDVVADLVLAKDQVVMRSPTAQLDAEQYRALKTARLEKYCRSHPVDPDGALLLLSEAALCLTAEDACLEASALNLGATGWIVEFRAIRDIQKGEVLGRHDQIDHWSME